MMQLVLELKRPLVKPNRNHRLKMRLGPAQAILRLEMSQDLRTATALKPQTAKLVQEVKEARRHPLQTVKQADQIPPMIANQAQILQVVPIQQLLHLAMNLQVANQMEKVVRRQEVKQVRLLQVV